MSKKSGNILLHNAKIRPFADRRTAEAMLIEDGFVSAVGSAAETEARSHGRENVRRVDLRGKTVLPGFFDSHLHLVETAKVSAETQLGGVRSIEELVERGRQYLANNPGGPEEWILGRGWNQESIAGKRYPTRHDLDSICPDRPMLYQRSCGIVGVLNTKGLEMMGIDEHFGIPGGFADMGEDGRPNGVVRREALDGWVKKRLPKPDKQRTAAMLKSVTQRCAACGMTSAQSDDLTFYPDPQKLDELYREVADNGELAVRVGQQYLLRDMAALEAFLAGGTRTGDVLDKNRRYMAGPLKVIVDGSLGSRTAALRAGYADAPGERGLFVHTDEELGAMFALAHRSGLQIAAHAIGDAALEKVLDLVERLQAKVTSPWRHRVVHCQIGDRALYERMRHLGVAADVQPPFVASDGSWVADRVGTARAAESYAWRTLLDLGIALGGSSDSPVEDFAPLWGVQVAVTRQDREGNPAGGWLPDQRLTLEAALGLYTAGSAAVCGEGGVKGTLEPGKLADFVVLNEDPFLVNSNDISRIPILLTVSGGETTHRGDETIAF